MMLIQWCTQLSRRAMAAKINSTAMLLLVDNGIVGRGPARLWATVSVVALAILAVVGCDKNSKTVSVGGAITYQGKPVTDGIINFIQGKARPLGGGINS